MSLKLGYSHTFNLGHAQDRKKSYGDHVFYEGQLVSTKIIDGLSEGHWVKARVIDVHLGEEKLNLEVLDHEKWNLKKLAYKVPFSLVDTGGNRALQDERNMLSLRVDQLLRQITNLRWSYDKKVRRKNDKVNYLKKQLKELRDQVKRMEKLWSISTGERLNELQQRYKNECIEALGSGEESKTTGIILDIGKVEPRGKIVDTLLMQRYSMYPVKAKNDYPSALALRLLLDMAKENASLKGDLAKVLKENQRLMISNEKLHMKVVAQDSEFRSSKKLRSKLKHELMRSDEKKKLIRVRSNPVKSSYGKRIKARRRPEIQIPRENGNSSQRKAISAGHTHYRNHSKSWTPVSPSIPEVSAVHSTNLTAKPHLPNLPYQPQMKQNILDRDSHSKNSRQTSEWSMSSQSSGSRSRSKNQTRSDDILRGWMRQLLGHGTLEKLNTTADKPEFEENELNSKKNFKMLDIVPPDDDANSPKSDEDLQKTDAIVQVSFSKLSKDEKNSLPSSGHFPTPLVTTALGQVPKSVANQSNVNIKGGNSKRGRRSVV